jgi:hypothetical protein
VACTARSDAVRLGLTMRWRWLCGRVALGFAVALAGPSESWARLRRLGCRGDPGLTPGSGSTWDKGNRSPDLSFGVRFQWQGG